MASDSVSSPRDDISPLALEWMYALLLDCGGSRDFISHHQCFGDDIARALGVFELAQQGDDPAPRSRKPAASFRERAMSALQRNRARHLKKTATRQLPDNLASNIDALAQLIDLDETDCKLLAFWSILKTESLLEDCANLLGVVGFGRVLRVLAQVLDLPQEALRRSLVNGGRLMRSGLLEGPRFSHSRCHLGDYLSFSGRDLLFSLRYHQGSPIGLFKSAFRPAPPCHLQRDDFQHMQAALETARSYLQHSLKQQQCGVNILIYGPPGTGKSQLTRLLASELQAELHEVACTDSAGDPINRHGRLCALRSAMAVLGRQRTLVVLDEIEDLFSNDGGLFGTAPERQKGWINRMLEENPLPCFWLTNNIAALDNAYIRRFDLVLKLDNPPRAQRERIIRKVAGDRLDDALLQQLASHEELMPAVITRALEVAGKIDPAAAPLQRTVQTLVDATLQAQGFERLGQSREQQLPAFYSPQLSNADIALDTLLGGLREHGQARLCFYGPSGTGKTAFAHWIARELGKPLLNRRASELISPYVGMTEKNLARAFEQAREDDAVLLLDEVDSFLQDRRTARHGWEITAVNEMLTQMESYPGLFIASTNLMGNLDEAALRRFDLKIGFDYLSAEQNAELLQQHLQHLQLDAPSGAKRATLLRQNRVTPGDFALLARRARFRSFADGDAFIDALLAETALKHQPAMQPIGFVH